MQAGQSRVAVEYELLGAAGVTVVGMPELGERARAMKAHLAV
ncbi:MULTISPECIES: hypothetical protein [unclassified Frankia]